MNEDPVSASGSDSTTRRPRPRRTSAAPQADTVPAAADEKKGKKTFVLDTNVLLHSAQALESFVDNHVVLPMAVLEELDKFKSQSTELGRNSRQVIRRLDTLRTQGALARGVPVAEGGSLRVLVTHSSCSRRGNG